MFTKLSNSWELAKASARVLAADKELIIFPIVSAIGTLIITITFAVPMFLSGFFDRLISESFQFISFLVLFLFYIVQYTVVFFANTALVGAAVIRLHGGDPTVRDGFRIAFSRLGPIIGYALIAATVGMILRAISERSRGLGRLAVTLVGFAWNIATYLVVPVLAVEGIGPIEAIKRSVSLLKKTWGEQIVGNIGISAIFTLITLVVLAIGIPVVILSFTSLQVVWVGVTAAILLVILLIIIGLINSTLSGIYSAAVYQYAANGEMSSYFDNDLVRHTFTTR
jgi:hypothetical protein